MKDCLRYAPMIGAREGELTAEEAEGLRAHLDGCATCRAIAADAALTDGLVGEALLARANARDFAPFVDEVMARVGLSDSARAEPRPARPELVEGRTHPARPELVEGRTHPARPERRPAAGRPESKGVLGWLHRHRRAALATLAPALAALAVIVYLQLGLGRSQIAMLELSSEGEATTILETQDGPVVLLSEENDS